MPSRRSRPHPLGFTLTELLVVVGVIALLVGILMPTLSGARRQANQVKCAANLRTLVQACQMHAQDHQGYFPIGGRLVSPPGTPIGNVSVGLGDAGRKRYTYVKGSGTHVYPAIFPAALAPYLGVRGLPWHDWKELDQALNAKRDVWRHLMCPDVDADEKQKYNDDPDDRNYAGQGMMIISVVGSIDAMRWAHNSDYGFNEGVLGYHHDRRYARNRLAGNAARVRRSGEVLLFADALPRKEPASAALPLGWIAWTPSLDNPGPSTLGDAFAGRPGAAGQDNFDPQRHKGRMNVAFLDGHVETVPLNRPALDRVFLIPPN